MEVKLDDEIFMHKDLFSKAKKAIISFINQNGSITVAELRDILNTNRKIALGLLERFDELGLTIREGNIRILNNNEA